MALGDNDLGIFFGDFADGMTFGQQSAAAIVDGAAKDGAFGTAHVSDVEFRAELAAAAFAPFPKSGDRVTVTSGRFAGAYIVRGADPLDDGATIELLLRKV